MSANSMPTAIRLFLMLVSLLAVVWRRISDSVISAAFSSHAPLARVSASLIRSVAFALRSSVSLNRSSVMPISFSVAIAPMPSSFMPPRPTINAWNASAGLLSHIWANCSLVMPATRAKSSSALDPVETAISILRSAFENALPPASASRPRELSAAENPRICGSVSPTCLPAAPMRTAISMMSASVVAKLLPRSTSVAPMFENRLCAMPVMLANFAIAEAASAPARLVLMPSRTMVSVKLSSASFSMPICPAIAMTSDMSAAPVARRLLMSMTLADNCAKNASASPLVTLTVFRTPANASS